MRKAIDRYILAKRAENAAPNTIRAYHADLIDLSNFMGPSQTPDRLSREIVRGFLSLLHRNGITKTTAVRKLAAIKSFSEWLRNEEVLDDDTYQKIALIKRPRLPDTLPDVPSQEQMRILLDGEFPTAFPERDKLILELLYGSGLRVSEAANTKLEDLRPEQRGILIHGKGVCAGWPRRNAWFHSILTLKLHWMSIWQNARRSSSAPRRSLTHCSSPFGTGTPAINYRRSMFAVCRGCYWV
jgi:site-specific recombinase XerD